MKKLLFLFIFFTAALWAADSIHPFYVENPTMGKAYYNIFNGLTALMRSETYGYMLKLIFLLGGAFVFIMGVFKSFQGADAKEAVIDLGKYMVAGVVLLQLVIPSGSNSNSVLSVESKVVPVYYCSSENNDASAYSGFTTEMPESLAWIFSTVNSIGSASTELAATVFSNVSTSPEVQAAFKASSVGGFGSETEQIQSLMRMTLSDFYDMNNSTFSTTSMGDIDARSVIGGYYGEFLKQCVSMVSSADSSLGTMISSTIAQTGDIHKSLNDLFPDNNGSTGTLRTYKNTEDTTGTLISTINPLGIVPASMLITVTSGEGNQVTVPCGVFYQEVIDNFVDKVQSGSDIACIPALKNLTASGVYTLTGSSTSIPNPVMEQIAINAALVSAYRTSTTSSRIGSDMALAQGKTNAEFVMNNTGSGFYMAKMLPYLQMGIRAVLYAFFPFVFLVMLLPGGFNTIKSYLESVLWVELWSPTAAILNMFLSYFTIEKTGSAYQSQGVSVISQTSIVTDANMFASVGGYLYSMVPALTYLILTGSGRMLSNITGGMAAGFSKNFNSEAIRRDLGKAQEAEKLSAKTGEDIGIAQMDMDKVMRNAEQESAKGAFYYNYGGGGKQNEVANALGVNETRLMAKNVAGGKNTTSQNLNDIEAANAVTVQGENKLAKMVNNENDKTKEALSGGAATTEHSKNLEKAKLVSSLKDRFNMSDKDVAQFTSDINAGKDVGKYKEETEYIREYGERHHMKTLNGEKIDKNTSAKDLAAVAESVSVDTAENLANERANNEAENQSTQTGQNAHSIAINSKKDMKTALENHVGENSSKFDIKEKNGEFIAFNKDSGKVYHANKGTFLRKSDKTFDSSTVETFGEKPSDRGSIVANTGSQNTNAMAAGRINAASRIGNENAFQNFSPKELQESFGAAFTKTHAANLAQPEAAREGIQKLMKGMELDGNKDTKSYRQLENIMKNFGGNKQQQLAALGQATYINAKTQGSNEYFNNASEAARQKMIADSQISVTQAGEISSLNTVGSAATIDEQDKFLENADITVTNKDGDREDLSTSYKATKKKYIEEGMSESAATKRAVTEYMSRMKGFTEANNVTIGAKTARTLLNEVGLQAQVGAQVTNTATNVGYASAAVEVFKQFNADVTPAQVGKALGGVQLFEKGAKLFASSALLTKALTKMLTGMGKTPGKNGSKLDMGDVKTSINNLGDVFKNEKTLKKFMQGGKWVEK